jgi:serine/threonine protein kinase
MRELAPGAVFAGHRIEALAGRGGMGVVYRATHLALERTVALKVVAPTLVEDPNARQRFLRESKTAASIDHPNVIPVYYTGEEDGIAYIAMRFVKGQDLRTLVRTEHGLDPSRAAHIVAQIGAALDAAHAAGLVHRDVKPANVLLAAGDHAYLSDFGLSKHALSVGGETRSGHWVGTLDYVAPEQIRGERLDARADVYALGCVLYFALTGEAPYPRDGDEAKLWAHLKDPAPKASDRVDDLLPGLDHVIARAMAKEPADRYPSAGDLGRAAEAAAGLAEVRERERVVGVGEAAPDETPTESATPPTAPALPSQAPTAVEPPAHRRPSVRIALAGCAAALAAVAAAVLLVDGKGTSPPPPPPPPFKPHEVWSGQVGGRPNSIAVGDGLVVATNYANRRLHLVDVGSDALLKQGPTVGVGGRDVATGAGAAWVAVSRQQAVFKLDRATGRRLGRIALAKSPQTVAVGHNAVWAGMTSGSEDVDDELVRIDPRTLRVTGTFAVPDGVHAIVSAPSGIWIVHRTEPAISRFDIDAGEITRRVAVGQSIPGDIAYSGGAVWVTSPQEDTVFRVDDATDKKVSSGVGRRPTGIAALGDQVWVTSYIDHTVTRIDPKTSRPVGDPVPVRLNPYALAITPDSVWLTAVGHGELARVQYREVD